jgi:cold shock protein
MLDTVASQPASNSARANIANTRIGDLPRPEISERNCWARRKLPGSKRERDTDGNSCASGAPRRQPIGPSPAVKFFNTTKGYGFIAPDTGGKDVFVHISAVEKAGLDSLREGDKVTYDMISDRGKESAGNLRFK